MRARIILFGILIIGVGYTAYTYRKLDKDDSCQRHHRDGYLKAIEDIEKHVGAKETFVWLKKDSLKRELWNQK